MVEPSAHVGAVISGLLLIVLPLELLVLLRHATGAEGATWIALAIASTWFGDAGAYLMGKSFGRHPLAPRTSPNKTVEGAIGGVVTTACLAVVASWTILSTFPVWKLLLVAVPANVLGQLGDLWESSLKRSKGVKDSGRVIPGYGGLLDKFDSLLMATPWLAGGVLWLTG